jgi:hypothetical protein
MFHSSNPSFFGRPTGVSSESLALRSTVSELRGVCLSLLRRGPRAFVDADRALADFAGRLSSYFDAGQGAPYFKTIVEVCPSLGARATSIEQDHEALMQSVDWVRGLTARANATRLARHIGGVLDRFEEHERAETALLQDFFLCAGEEANGEVRT